MLLSSSLPQKIRSTVNELLEPRLHAFGAVLLPSSQIEGLFGKTGDVGIAHTDDEIVKACQVSVAAGADFVKTSTGFSTGGATVEAVRLMRKTVGAGVGVKASGGIRNLETARAMVEAGASRLGCSSGVAIAKGEEADADY